MPPNPPTEDRTWKPIRPWVRRLELKASVGPSPVVVGGVDPKDSLEVAAPQDQHPVQAFGPDRADPPLGERVRLRGPDRGLDDLHPFGPEDLVERTGELGIPVADEEPDALKPLLKGTETLITPATCPFTNRS